MEAYFGSGLQAFQNDPDNDDDWYEEEQWPHIEYFTDAAGQWYIYDWDYSASYYLHVAEAENQAFFQESLAYFDGCWSEEDYHNWDAYYDEEEYDEED